MKKIFFLISLLLLGLNVCMASGDKESDSLFFESLSRLYMTGEFENAAKVSMNYFVSKNDSSWIFNKYGEVDGSLANYLRSNPKLSYVKLPVSGHRYYYRSINVPWTEYEMKCYYMAAEVFYKLANTAWDKGDSRIVHFKTDTIYPANSCKIAYHYMAYILSDLCLEYIMRDKYYIELLKEDKTKESDSIIHLYYNIAIRCQAIKSMYDYRYYDALGMLICDIDKKMYAGLGYLCIAKPPKKSLKTLKKIKREAHSFANKHRSTVFANRVDEILYEIEYGTTIKDYLRDYIPYITSEYQRIKYEEGTEERVKQFDYLQKLNTILNSAQVLMYYASKKEIETVASTYCDAMISMSVADLYAQGAKQYENYKEVNWRDVQRILKDGEYAVQLFESSNGNDRWLLGYVFSNNDKVPQVKYFGHSYWSERDAFRDFEYNFPNAKSVYYVGLPTMALQDAELGKTQVHRLFSLAELCLPQSRHMSKGKENFIIADVNFSENSTQSSSGKGLSELFGNFPGDKEITRFLDSLFPQKCIILGGDTVSGKKILELSGNDYGFIHISTHGLYNDVDEYWYNYLYPYDANTGVNTMKSIYFALSDYNSNKNKSITAYEISKMDFSKTGLIFLSTCESANGNINTQRISSMAKAFHLAGAKNIIAFMGTVQSKDADEFTRAFYRLLSSGTSIHDAFYSVKNNIQSLKDGDNGDVKVILWE